MGLKRVLLLSCAATGTFLGLGSAAFAQDSSGGIGEVVVTAEKREQSVQDVPVAVTAITADTREDLGIISMEDYARVAPGVVYTNNDRLTIRGIGRMTNAIGTDPGAAAYNDGIFSNSMQFSTASPMYLSRTEILRGPQGTLYGRNAVAGLINVISRDPSDEWEGEIRSRIGNYGRHDFEGLVSGPITDNLRFYAGYSTYNQTEGLVENLGSGEDTGTQFRTYYEGKIQWEPTDTIEMNFRIQAAMWDDTYGVGNVLESTISPYNTYTNDNNAATVNDSVFGAAGGGQNLYFNPTYTGVADGLINGFANPAVTNPYQIRANRDAIGELHDNITSSFNLSWDVGAVTIKYLAGWAGYKYYTTGRDADQTDQTGLFTVNNLVGPGGAPFGSSFTATGVSHDLIGDYHEAQEWYSNEINISSNGDGPVNWIVGLYQYHQDYSQDIGLRVANDVYVNNPVGYLRTPAPCPAALCGVGNTNFLQLGPNTGGNAPNPNGHLVTSRGTLLVDSYAAFGQVDWEFSPGLTAVLGIRYSSDDKEGYDYARIIGRTATTAVTSNGTFPTLSVLSLGQAVGIFATANYQQAADLSIAAMCLPNATLTMADCPADFREAVGGGLERDREYSSDAWSGTAKLIWEPNNDLNFYASYSRGYKSGGWFGISTLAPGPYARPEFVDAYEVGAKMILTDTFLANVSVYRNEITDMQVPFTSFNGTVSQTNLENVDSEVQGVELELQWLPVEQLQLFANIAYTDSEYTSGCCFVDPADPTATGPGAQPSGPAVGAQQPQTIVGNSNVNAPEFRWAVGGVYTWPTDIGAVQFSALYTHTDAQQYRPFNNPIWTSPSNEIANFRLIWTSPDEATRIALYANNAFDEEAYLFSEVYSNPDPTHPIRRGVALNIPQEYGVELQFHF